MKIKYYLNHNGRLFDIGNTSLNPNVINSDIDNMKSYIETDNHTIKRLAQYPCCGDDYIYLYQIYNHNDCELHFYTAGDVCLYDKNGYHQSIMYENKLNATDVKTAFIEFAEYCEPLSY